MNTKNCSKCKENKELSLYAKRKDTKDGRVSECKRCASIRTKKYNTLNKEKVKTYQNNYIKKNKEKIRNREKNRTRTYTSDNYMLVFDKTCSKCNITKKIKLFHKDSRRKDGHRSECKECVLSELTIVSKDKRHEYYLKNKEKIALSEKEYRLKNKEKIAIRKKEYKKNNPEKHKSNIENLKQWKIDNPDKVKASHAKYYKTDRGKASARRNHIKQRLKRKKHKQDGDVTTAQMLKLVSECKNCYWCGEIVNDNYHIDHYFPLSKGGKDTISNLVVSCPACNLSKSSKDPFLFANSRGMLF